MHIDIPGFGILKLKHLVSDYTGTLSHDGKLISGVSEMLAELSRIFTIHVLTADTFGMATSELSGITCSIQILSGSNVAEQKQSYVEALGADSVIAIGNGNNDKFMLKTARVGIAVMEGDGCAAIAIANADVVARNIHEALGMILHPKRLIANLRC